MSDEVVVAILAAMLPVALTTGLAWLERRGQESRRDQAIESTHKRLQLLHTYLEAQQIALPPEQFAALKLVVAQEIDQLLRALNEQLQILDRTLDTTRNRSVFQRLFLWHRLRTGWAQTFRALFYLALLLSTLLSISFISTIVTQYGDSPAVAFVALVILIAPTVLPTLLFRWLALRSDRRAG
jgi:hypothetical protein